METKPESNSRKLYRRYLVHHKGDGQNKKSLSFTNLIFTPICLLGWYKTKSGVDDSKKEVQKKGKKTEGMFLILGKDVSCEQERKKERKKCFA